MKLMLAGFGQADPLPVPELAIPVAAVEKVGEWGQATGATEKEKAVGDLAIIAFYYLLRVGEYTFKRRRGRSRTIQFRFCDIAFKKGNEFIPRNAPIDLLMQTTAATLRLSNQKNGIRGSLIHRDETKGAYCPVQALVRRFLHLRDNDAQSKDNISAYWDHLGIAQVMGDDIIKAIRAAVGTLKLHLQGITPDRVGSHSLRDGGAMALKFSGADRDDIKKLG